MNGYRSPIPFVVALIPVSQSVNGVGRIGVVGVVRGNQPALGSVALPGGPVGENEDLRAAASRVVKEKTGMGIPADEWFVHEARTTPNNHLLLFVRHKYTTDWASLEPLLRPSPESLGFVFIDERMPLGFQLHQEVARQLLKTFNH